MTSKERIEHLQKTIDTVADGIIGKNTLKVFSKYYNKSITETINFFTQIHHESGGFTIGRENMNYSESRIMEIFGVGKHSAKVTSDQAKILAGHPYKLAERVYGILNPKKAKELGNTKAGDGWLYRGGGALQITGKSAYKQYGGNELVENPDLIEDSTYYFTTALAEFDQRGIWALCKDLSDESLLAVTKRVNGGFNGLQDRRNKFNYYKKMMGV